MYNRLQILPPILPAVRTLWCRDAGRTGQPGRCPVVSSQDGIIGGRPAAAGAKGPGRGARGSEEGGI